DRLYLLYECLEEQGKKDEAAVYLARFQQLEDDLRQLEKVIHEIGKAPMNPEPRYQAGMICLRNGQEQEALRWLFGALEKDPRHRPTHTALAEYYERTGDRVRAAEHRKFATP